MGADRADNLLEPQPVTLYRSSDLHQTGGFSLHQIDPVGAKCLEIQTLLRNSEAFVSPDIVTRYLTRTNLATCIELYGRHFQPNVPILHMPTFNVAKTSPILLLAMMLVGACYSNKLIPVSHINKLAMQLLTLIEHQPHERNMEAPPLSTIQASVMLRPILACSRNETAFIFASIHFPRSISMAERAGLFDPATSIDYSNLNDCTFNWDMWIQQETRKRIACQMFCQDMALCVFRRRSPSFSPPNFHVELPCYESCWEAETAADCFQHLQLLPPPLRVSTATQHIGSEHADEMPTFEASAFGMFILIMGECFSRLQIGQ